MRSRGRESGLWQPEPPRKEPGSWTQGCVSGPEREQGGKAGRSQGSAPIQSCWYHITQLTDQPAQGRSQNPLHLS